MRMNNDNSPGSNHESPLDRAIDRAVRRMMSRDARAGFRQRVLARLDKPESPRWAGFPRFAAGAAVLAAVVLGVLLLPQSPNAPSVLNAPGLSRVEPPAVSPVGEAAVSPAQAATPTPPVNSKEERPAASKAAARVSPHRDPIPMPRITNVFGARGAQVSAANAPAKSVETAPAEDAALRSAPRPSAAPAPPPAQVAPQTLVDRVAAEARAKAAPPVGPASGDNVTIELTLTEIGGDSAPVVRTLTMQVPDRQSGGSRRGEQSTAAFSADSPSRQRESAAFTADAQPIVYPDNSVLVALTLDYVPGAPAAGRASGIALHETMRVMVSSGQPVVVAQASDPTGARRVTVTLKATVVK